MTYESAARHLHCPLGTLSVRLKRAKERLKARLSRRGLAVAAGLPDAGDLPRGGLTQALAASTARAAVAFSTGEGASAGLISASVLNLTRGALKAMSLIQLKVCGLFASSLALLVLGGGTLVGQQEGTKRKVQGVPPPAGVRGEPPPRVDSDLASAESLVEAARRRVEAQRGFYDEGRITIDRFLDAIILLKNAEVKAAATPEARVAAIASALERVREVEKQERHELEVGRGTVADIAEAAQAREQVELELREARRPSRPPDLESLDRRLSALERKVDLILRSLPPSPAPRR